MTGARPDGHADNQPDHWFEPLAEHLGAAYLRYSFTKGTRQEVDFLVEALRLSPGDRILDVGCGPGRHAVAFSAKGMPTHGIDISDRFVALAAESAPPGATFERLDARLLRDEVRLHGVFDAVVCLCQGAFGLMTADGDDDAVIAGMAKVLRPGGRLALTAFSAYFVVRHWEGADFDAASGVNHERTELRNEDGAVLESSLWTGCYTPRELRLLCRQHGFRVDSIASVEPGAYGRQAPTVERPELLVLATLDAVSE